jgi:hypothetical protein
MSYEATGTHAKLKYTSIGNGLCRNGHTFEADLTPYLPALLENGRPRKSDATKKPQRALNWWQAQCAFRGLPLTGGLNVWQDRLRSGLNVVTMTQALLDLEKKLDAESKAKIDSINRDEAREWEEYEKNAEEEAIRFLIDAFEVKDRKKPPDAITIKQKYLGYPAAAVSLNLFCRIVRAPIIEEHGDYDWAVIGVTKQAMENKIAGLEKESNDCQAAKAQAKRVASAKRLAAVAKSSEKNGVWDITGTWRLISEEVEDTKSGNPADYWTLQIYRIDGRKGSQIFGRFEFGPYIVGYIRFEKPSQIKLPQVEESVKAGQKRKRAADEDNLTGRSLSSSIAAPTTGSDTNSLLRALAEERRARQNATAPQAPVAPTNTARTKTYRGEYDSHKSHSKYDINDSDEEKINEAFLLSSTDQVSPDHPKWNFRWRGREAYSDEIQHNADIQLHSITFSEEGGARCAGTFECDCQAVHMIKFSGVKVALQNSEDTMCVSSLETEWQILGEDGKGSKWW